MARLDVPFTKLDNRSQICRRASTLEVLLFSLMAGTSFSFGYFKAVDTSKSLLHFVQIQRFTTILLAAFIPEHIQIWGKFPVWYHVVFLVTRRLSRSAQPFLPAVRSLKGRNKTSLGLRQLQHMLEDRVPVDRSRYHTELRNL
jgi:hypothetical protein